MAAVPGDTLVYTLTYDNIGTRGAAGVEITETVPANATFDVGSSTAGWSCADNAPATSTCTFTLGVVEVGDAAGTVDFAVTVDATVPSGTTTIENDASITDDGTDGTDPVGNNAADDDDLLTAAPDLAVTKSDAVTEVTPGSTLAYTIVVDNRGNEGSAGSTLTDVVPANTTFDDAATTAPWVCLPADCGGLDVFVDPRCARAAGDDTTVDFVVTLDPTVPAGTTEISNSARITDNGVDGADTDPGNDVEGDKATPVYDHADHLGDQGGRLPGCNRRAG